MRKPTGQTAIALYAFQESGRIVMAYAFGYRCKGISLEALFNSCSRTEIDFGDDIFIVSAMIAYAKHPALLNCIIEKKFTISPDFIDRLSIILLAGFVSRRTYAETDHSSVEIEINPADKEDLSGIESFVSAKTQQSNHEFHENLLMQAEGMLRMKIIWNAVECVAKLLLSQPTRAERYEIEAALRQLPFWRFANV